MSTQHNATAYHRLPLAAPGANLLLLVLFILFADSDNWSSPLSPRDFSIGFARGDKIVALLRGGGFFD